MSSPSYTSSSNAFAVFQSVSSPSPFGSSALSLSLPEAALAAPPTALCRSRGRRSSSASSVNTLFETQQLEIDAPPRYSTILSSPSSSSLESEPETKKGFFSFLGFTRRTRRSSSPPPYVNAEEELADIESRLKAMDEFFGGAAF